MTTNDSSHLLPPIDRLLRLGDVKALTGLSRTRLYLFASMGTFPRPVRIGPKAVAWRLSEINTWIAERPSTRSEKGQGE
jgi:prophage regulatory protein